MFEHVITSLAVLKVNWDKGHDYIENFVPFVAECLRISPTPEVSLPEVQRAMAETFGLRVPQGALKTVLKRLTKRRYVERAEGIYRRNDEALATIDIAPVRDEVLRQHERLVEKLTEFCSSRYSVTWSKDDAEAALLSYLKERSIPVLAAAVEGRPITADVPAVKHADFLVNAFIAHVHHADPEGFKYLETVVKGNILANVLIFPDLGGISQRFDNVEVYFDSSVLLRALGLEGPGPQAPCRELIDLLYEENCGLRCFKHTYDEIWGILDAAEHVLRDPGGARHAYGKTLEYLISLKFQPSDVELVMARLEGSLRGLRVQVKTKPPHEPALTVSETNLAAILREEVRYHSEDALYHDLDSLTAIHRLRRGQLQHRLESCRAIFITNNPNLARGNLRFRRAEYRDAAATVPDCMLDHMFGTLVWLKKPMSAPDLPRKRIIAECYAALNPPDGLWKHYLGEIDKLQQRGGISEEDYYLLRYSMEARTGLMDLTYGDASVFTEKTVEQILEKARAAARAQTEAALRTEEGKRLEAERRAAEAEAHLEAMRLAQLQRVSAIAAWAGGISAQLILCVALGVLALGVYFTLPRPFPRCPWAWRKFVPFLLVIAVGIFTITHHVFGANLLSLTRRLELFVSRCVERALMRITGAGGGTST
jgi:hypothetical protein